MESAHACELCERTIERLTKHHLIPRSRHKNKKNKKNFNREEIHERVIWICSPCHKNIHAVLTEKELEYNYNTVEAVAAHPGVKKFTEWVKKQPDRPIRVRTSKEKAARNFMKVNLEGG